MIEMSVGFMTFVCLAGSLASFADGANPNYYFRAGFTLLTRQPGPSG